MADVKKSYTFTIFIEEMEGAHIAHALEAGMVATADDVEDALHKMCKMLVRHIEFAEKHGRPDQIYHPAPPEVWQRFAASKDSGEARLFERKERLLFDNRNRLLLNQNAYGPASSLVPA
jgi:hypothetical protein